MSQILDLSKRFTEAQIKEAEASSNQYEDVPAGGYVCKIVDAILNDNAETGKANIELHLDIAEGKYTGYFQGLEDRAGFWGLRGYMSFKDSQIAKFKTTCASINSSNAGYSFDPLSGPADVDTLKDKLIGVVIGKEEYRNKKGDIAEKSVVNRFTSLDRIKSGKFKVPELKKLASEVSDGFMDIPENSPTEIPFD